MFANQPFQYTLRVSSRNFGLRWKEHGNFTNYIPLSIAKNIFLGGKGIAWFSVSYNVANIHTRPLSLCLSLSFSFLSFPPLFFFLFFFFWGGGGGGSFPPLDEALNSPCVIVDYSLTWVLLQLARRSTTPGVIVLSQERKIYPALRK